MTDSAATVLLAGCGDVGTALGLRLSERGVRAVGVRRRTDALPEPIEPVSLDLTDPGDAVLPAADAVVVTLTADGRDAAAYERTYLGALRGLRRALPADAAPRVVLVSSTGVLGGADGEVVTEATPPDPQRATAHVLLAAEELAAELFPDLVIVRPAGIYGPGRTSLIERVRKGAPVTHRRVTNRIHRDDLVTVLTAVLDAPEPPRLLHAVDHDAARLGDVVTHLAERLGVPGPPDNSPSGDGPLGKIIDGALVHSLVPRSRWRYPTFREGYDALLGTASSGERDVAGRASGAADGRDGETGRGASSDASTESRGA
ncbi:NAD-dependent epimerase/dehydratase family protein [Kocuria marina]|uniref:NAD-dependent epimerase/dehydratase family protein n=1 Tax=Kocuria marina TaxID=223184 RepID=UPI0021A70C1E|nr:NAD-dependent epimerase/dehydratase family protein [Kocuria marina]MCT1615988.1 NAD-dependent dehydratase [Kocuria marina]